MKVNKRFRNTSRKDACVDGLAAPSEKVLASYPPHLLTEANSIIILNLKDIPNLLITLTRKVIHQRFRAQAKSVALRFGTLFFIQ